VISQNQWFAAWLPLMIDTVVYLVLCVVMFSYLKRNHLATWDGLGSPSLFWNNSIRNNMLFLKFLLWRDYKRLNDSTLTQIANATLMLFWVAAVLFPIVAVGVFLVVPPGAK